MKTRIRSLVISSIAIVATAAIFSSCQKEMLNSDPAQYASVLNVAPDGVSTVIDQNMQLALAGTTTITDLELASLIKMRDEERLARDVYSALYQKWDNVVFSRISTAENNHLNAIVRLLQYLGSSDTLIGEVGIFADNDLQNLYNGLVDQGSQSIEEAFKIGAMIEEMDIKDLSAEIAAIANTDIIMVYENLELGSRNHLRSFYNQLNLLGIVYTPLYLSQDEYDQIVTTAMEKGKQYKMKGKRSNNCDGTGKGKRKGRN